ncbi:MAG: hypothetical protein AAGE59_20380 [Cyanobacteria bacterium P01_F01_bin.86]
MDYLFETIVDFYETKMSWPMEHVENDTILSVKYQGKEAQWVFVAATHEDDIITLFARTPEPCPEHLLNVMSEFLEYANFGMTHGAWVMDRSDGEIRYRVGVVVGELAITDNYLQNLTLYTNLTMDRYLPGIRAILRDGKTAADAFSIVFPMGLAAAAS